MKFSNLHHETLFNDIDDDMNLKFLIPITTTCIWTKFNAHVYLDILIKIGTET